MSLRSDLSEKSFSMVILFCTYLNTEMFCVGQLVNTGLSVSEISIYINYERYYLIQVN